MADCPKCGAHVKIYQMSPYCKSCGMNLMFASFEGQFEKDRRIAEMSMANFRYLMTKVKSAFVSGSAQKLKIVSVLFPVIALFLPLGSLSVTTPVYDSHTTFNVLGLFYGPLFGNGLFGKLDSFSGAPVFGEIASSLKPLIIVYAIVAASAVVILLSELLCFIGNKKTGITIIVFSAIGMIGSLLVKIVSSPLIKACENAGSLADADCGILFLVSCILFAVPIAASVFALKKPPVYNFREGDELRVEYRKKYKKGLIKLMDIPAPIYESEEDKKEKRKLISEAYNINEEEEASQNV